MNLFTLSALVGKWNRKSAEILLFIKEAYYLGSFYVRGMKRQKGLHDRQALCYFLVSIEGSIKKRHKWEKQP